MIRCFNMFKPSTRLSWTYRRRCPKAKVAGKAVQGTMGVENASKPEMRNGASQGQKKTTLAKISNLQDMKWKQVKQYETIKVIKVKSKTYCSGPRWAQMGPVGYCISRVEERNFSAKHKGAPVCSGGSRLPTEQRQFTQGSVRHSDPELCRAQILEKSKDLESCDEFKDAQGGL